LHSLAEADGVPAHPLATVRGEDVPAEHDVAGVAGWAGSLPIRVGNDAAGQVQYDALGMLVEAVSVYLQTGGRLQKETWRMVRSVADRCCAPAEPSSGIWEFRTESMLTSADVGRWLALDRAVWIARGWRPATRRRKWMRARDEARALVLASLTPQGRLPQCYDGKPRADAAALMVVVFGMLGRDDPRAHAIVDDVIGALGAGPFLYRYEPDASDGFAGREGAFIPVSWWAVSALACLGRVDEARARADAMDRLLPRLQSEEINPETGESLGNVPLVWSHMENARALYILDAATKRERFGPAGLMAWRLARYARLRFRA
ncbi:MAG TPA: glycoside hydrolase family 15 protein, partial [Mycobacteriales bacterium]|nr:glycoside hydrolase family 15 protein [Mycobacteriales bacterium]